MNGYGAIAVNDEADNLFLFFYLHLSHINPNNMWNQMEINWHLGTRARNVIYKPPGRQKP